MNLIELTEEEECDDLRVTYIEFFPAVKFNYNERLIHTTKNVCAVSVISNLYELVEEVTFFKDVLKNRIFNKAAQMLVKYQETKEVNGLLDEFKQTVNALPHVSLACWWRDAENLQGIDIIYEPSGMSPYLFYKRLQDEVG